MPRVAAYGKARLYPAYQVYTVAECEKALSTGVLPDVTSIAAMSKGTTPILTVRESLRSGGAAVIRAAVDDVVFDESENELRASAVSPLRAQSVTGNQPAFDMGTDTDTGADEAQQIAALMASLARKNPGAMDEAKVRALIAEILKESGAGRESLSVTVGDLPAVEMDGQHESFPLLLAVAAARVPCMLVGPAGSGKTSAAHAAANALGLSFYCMSVGPQTSKSDFKGYRDANGLYHRTPLREAYEGGGVFLIDEIDAALPGTLTEMNAALANQFYTFGDGVRVDRHPDFIPVAAANTFGTGADRQYVGRNQLDAATLDRFFSLEWGYDEAFEAALVGIKRARTYQTPGDSDMCPTEWYEYVVSVRAAIATAKIRHVVSPRATIYGARLLRVIRRETLEEGLIWKGLSAVQRDQIKVNMSGRGKGTY